MAKRVKASDVKAISNGYDGEKLKGYVEKIEAQQAEIDTAKAQYMNRCRQIRGSMDVVYKEAKALGYSTRSLKTHIDLRVLERRKAALVDKLDGDEAETFEMMADALGDFASSPLGQAAIRTADPASRSALDSLN